MGHNAPPSRLPGETGNRAVGPYRRGRDGQLEDPEIGQHPTPVQRLHAEIARLHPSGKLEQPGLISLGIGKAVLDQAWNPRSDRLLDRSIYELVVDNMEPKPTAKQRHRVMQLYNAAAGVTVKGWNEREEQAKRRQAQLRAAERMLKAIPLRDRSYLPSLSTEQQFMNHLRSLRTRGGLSLRAVADRMAELAKAERAPHAARSATTLHAILKRDIVPGDTKLMQMLLGALIAALPDGQFGDVQDHQVLEDHLAAWRKLINIREGANQRPEVAQTIIDTLAMLKNLAERGHEPELAGLDLAIQAAELAADGHTIDRIQDMYADRVIERRLRFVTQQGKNPRRRRSSAKR
jgi:hypothetical protein